MKNFILCLCCMVPQLKLVAQTSPNEIAYYNDFNFIIHLTNNKLFDEAEKERDALFSAKDLNPLYIDSVNYFIGMAYYNEKKFDQARQSLLKVSDNVFFYFRARYLAGLIDTENNQLDAALVNYKAISESTNPDLNDLKNFEIAGIYLLKKNFC